MHKLFLLLGGNIGDKKQLFMDALQRIQKELGEILKISSIYETEPWGFQSDDLFWNLAIEIETKLEPEKVLDTTQRIEKELGRVRKTNQYESRPMDIDIMFYDDLILDTEKLVIPHPRITERRFVLEPLAELTPDYIHPVLQLKVEELLKRCEDNLLVKKLKKLEEL